MKSAEIKLINLNIEGDKHLDRVIPFLKTENADVVCLQEVLEKDIDFLTTSLKMQGHYVPCLYIKYKNSAGFPPGNNFGILILTKIKDFKIDSRYYAGNDKTVPILIGNNPNVANRILLILEFKINNTQFRIITSHFTWSSDGQTTSLQREHVRKMLGILSLFDNFVLCGDFNAPRGREIWWKIASKYKDNIPANISSTIDSNLHRVKKLSYVVDGLFSTPQYKIKKVRIVDQVSDHKAIVAFIYKPN